MSDSVRSGFGHGPRTVGAVAGTTCLDSLDRQSRLGVKLPHSEGKGRTTIFGEHDYMGPWFVACDHGCAHDSSTHGALPATHNACFFEGGVTQATVVALCQRAIASSDLVFAWIDSLDAFGTIAELGYAAALKIPIAIGMPNSFRADDLWFIEKLAAITVRHAAAAHALAAAVQKIQRWKAATALCESPIERKLLDAFLARGFTLEATSDGPLARGHSLALYQQHPVGPYRLDFALVSGSVRVAIETDGHDFHEKTKEQARKDKSRDRFLVGDGWHVLRFTGQEVHEDADRCAGEAVGTIRRLIDARDEEPNEPYVWEAHP